MADPVAVAIPAGTLLTMIVFGGIGYAIMQNKNTKSELKTEAKINEKFHEAQQNAELTQVKKDVEAMKNKSGRV